MLLLGSFGGGIVIDVEGDGFSKDCNVTVCGTACVETLFFNATHMTCTTPERTLSTGSGLDQNDLMYL